MIREFIEDSKALLDFSRCAAMVTRYKENVFNFRHYSQQIGELEKKMKSEDITAMVLNLAVEKYFNGTNASDAISAAIKDIHEVTGEDPRETVLKILERRWEIGWKKNVC